MSARACPVPLSSTTGQLRHLLDENSSEATCITFSPDGSSLITGQLCQGDSLLQVWNVHAGQKMHSFGEEASTQAMLIVTGFEPAQE